MDRAQLLVTVDSLRYDHYRHLSETRSFLDAPHERAYATFPSTLGSCPAIIGGQYATTSGLPAGTSVVPHLADPAVGITTNHLLSPGYGYEDGFEHFTSPRAGGESIRERLSARIPMGSRTYAVAAAGWNALQRTMALVRAPERTFRPAGDVIDEFLELVAGEDAWFGWLHLMEPHHPYEPADGPVSRVKGQNLTRKALSGRASSREADVVRELYRREVEELDAALARLWSAIPDDTEVVFTADHGELLGEDGRWGHPGELREELLHVPFATRNVSADLGPVVSLIDVPTILRGATHGSGEVPRELAFATYGETRAVTDGESFVTSDDAASGKPALVSALERFDVDSGLTRDDALERDLEALGYL